MGNPKQKWTPEEEQALRDGVDKYGPGKWKCIHNDPAFAIVLHSRSNIDLKDKWRNLSAAAQGLTTARSRNPKPKPPEDTPAAPVPPVNTQPAPIIPVAPRPITNPVKEETVKNVPDKKIGSRGNDTIGMVFEALAAAKQNGMDIGSIISYLEQRIMIESPQTFKKQLGQRLRKLVTQEKLEKVSNCYRLKNKSLVEANANNCKEIRPMQHIIPALSKVYETLQEAAKTAAYKVVEAEEMSYFAAVSVREVEKLSKMQEESEAILRLAQEIYDRWHNNEVPLIA